MGAGAEAALAVVLRLRNEMSSQLAGVRGSLQQFAGDALKVGGVLTAGVSLPLLKIAKDAVDVASTFEAQMNVLTVAARSSGTGMADLSQAALLVGKDTQLVGINSQEAAEAMTNFYKAGLSTADIFGGQLNGYLATGTDLTGALRSAIDLTAASELSLNDASMLVASSMATFGLAADDTTRIANAFVGAADASLASVGDLAAAMENLGPTAAAMGWSLEETNTALALLSTRGIMGAEAGTALKSMMTNLMSPTKETTQALSELNVKLFDEAGAMLPLPAIIAQLSGAMAGMTEEQRLQYIQTLAGSYGMKAMNTLLAEGPAGWDAMATAVANAATAQEVAGARTQGLKAAWEQLQGALETVYISVGLPLIQNFLTPLVQKATELLSGLLTLNPQVQNAALAFVAVLAAAGPVLLMLSGLATLIGALLSPIGLVVVAVAALAAAWATDFGGIREKTAEVLGVIVPIFREIATWIQVNLPAALERLRSAWAPVLLAIRGDWKGAWQALKAEAIAVWNSLTEAASTAWENLKAAIAQKTREALTAVLKWLDDTLVKIEGFDLKAAAAKFFATALAGIALKVSEALTAVGTWLSDTAKKISGFSLKGSTETSFQTVITGIITKAVDILKEVVAFLGNVKKKISEYQFKSATMTALQTMILGIIEKATDILAEIGRTLMSIGNAIKNFSLADAGRALIQGMIDGVTAMANALIAAATGVVSSAIQAAKNLLGIHSPSTVFAEMGRQIIEGLIEGMDEEKAAAAAKVADAVATIVQAAVDAAQALQEWKPVEDLGVITGQVMDFLLGVESQFTALVALVDQKLADEAAALAEALGKVVGVFGEALGFIGELRDLIAGGAVITNSASLPQPLIFLKNVLRRLAELMQELMVDPLLANLDDEFVAFNERLKSVVGPFAEAVGFISELRDLVAGGEVVTNSETLAQPLVFLKNVLRRMTELLAELRSDPLLAGLDNELVAFSGRLTAMVGPFGEVLGFIGDLRSLVADGDVTTNSDTLPQPLVFLKNVLRRMAELLTELQADPLLAGLNNELVAFSERLKGIVGSFQEALGFVAALADYVSPDAGVIDTLVSDIVYMVAALNFAAAALTDTALARALRIADVGREIYTALAAGIAAASGIGEGAGVGGLTQAMDQLTTAVSAAVTAILAQFMLLADAAYNAGYGWANSLALGIWDGLPLLEAALQAVADLFPHSPAKAGPLRRLPDWDAWMLPGLDEAAAVVGRRLSGMGTSGLRLAPAPMVPVLGGRTASGPVVLNFTYAPAVSLADEREAQERIAPMLRSVLAREARR